MQKGNHHTPEAIEKIRQANLGRKQSEATKAKKNLKLKGRTRTAETIAKISAAKTGMKYKKNKEVRP